MRDGMGAGPAAGLSEIEAAIEDEVLRQLRAVPVEHGRPMLVVDCDEVMVDLGGHLGRYAARHGIEMHLERYELEGSFRHASSGELLPFPDVLGLLTRFFEEETRDQQAIPGAVATLERLSELAQIVVLTNVPRAAREARIENLAALGMGYPLVENSGGKGPALAWLGRRAGLDPTVSGGPMVFVDDSPGQIASAARDAPGILRVHFAGAEAIARVIPEAPEADHRAASWLDAERAIIARLGAANR